MRLNVWLSATDRMQNGPSYSSSAAMYPEKFAKAQSKYSPVTSAAALFSPRLHPVLNRGEGDEHAVVTPQVP